MNQPPTGQERIENYKAIQAMHPGNRFRLMFGMPLLPESNQVKTMKIEMPFPEVFASPTLINTREPAALCADGLAAWAVCMCGNKPPDSFGETLVAIGKRLGMKGAATAEGITAHAIAMGYLPG